MSGPRIVDELDGDPPNYERRDIGESWRSEAHVLIVLAGDGDGPEYAVAHPLECNDDCPVVFELHVGGYCQPPGYPQIPTEPGLHLIWVEYVKGGWINGSHPVDSDAYLVLGQPGNQAEVLDE